MYLILTQLAVFLLVIWDFYFENSLSIAVSVICACAISLLLFVSNRSIKSKKVTSELKFYLVTMLPLLAFLAIRKYFIDGLNWGHVFIDFICLIFFLKAQRQSVR